MSDIDELGPDPIDRAVGARLRAIAPEAGDPDAVLAALRPRLVRARHARRAGFVAAGAAALALVAGVVFAATGSAPRGSVEVPPAHQSTVTGPQPTAVTHPPDLTESEPTHPETETERTGTSHSTATSADPATSAGSASSSGSPTPATTGVAAGSGSQPPTTTTTTARSGRGSRPTTTTTTDDSGADDGHDDADPPAGVDD